MKYALKSVSGLADAWVPQGDGDGCNSVPRVRILELATFLRSTFHKLSIDTHIGGVQRPSAEMGSTVSGF